jgi:hypothetical protein
MLLGVGLGAVLATVAGVAVAWWQRRRERRDEAQRMLERTWRRHRRLGDGP